MKCKILRDYDNEQESEDYEISYSFDYYTIVGLVFDREFNIEALDLKHVNEDVPSETFRVPMPELKAEAKAQPESKSFPRISLFFVNGQLAMGNANDVNSKDKFELSVRASENGLAGHMSEYIIHPLQEKYGSIKLRRVKFRKLERDNEDYRLNMYLNVVSADFDTPVGEITLTAKELIESCVFIDPDNPSEFATESMLSMFEASPLGQNGVCLVAEEGYPVGVEFVRDYEGEQRVNKWIQKMTLSGAVLKADTYSLQRIENVSGEIKLPPFISVNNMAFADTGIRKVYADNNSIILPLASISNRSKYKLQHQLHRTYVIDNIIDKSYLFDIDKLLGDKKGTNKQVATRFIMSVLRGEYGIRSTYLSISYMEV